MAPGLLMILLAETKDAVAVLEQVPLPIGGRLEQVPLPIGGRARRIVAYCAPGVPVAELAAELRELADELEPAETSDEEPRGGLGSPRVAGQGGSVLEAALVRAREVHA